MPAHHSCPSAEACTVTPLESPEALAEIAPDWANLCEAARNPNPFASPEWFFAWRQALFAEHSGNRIHAFALRERGRLTGVLPLVQGRYARFGLNLRRLEFVCNFADYNELLVGGVPRQFESVLRHLARTGREWDMLHLRGLRDETLAAWLPQAASAAGLCCRIVPEEQRCPFLAIDGPAEKLMERLPASARANLRRRASQARAAGLTVRIVREPHKEPLLLEKMIAVEEMKHRDKSTPRFIGRYPAAFHALFQKMGPRGWLYAALLEKDSALVGYQLGFLSGARLWDYTKAYDPAYARLAPGTLLMPPLLDFAYESGLDEYDFLCGEEPYKKLWSTGYHSRFQLLVWPAHLGAKMRAFLYNDLRPALRRMVRRG